MTTYVHHVSFVPEKPVLVYVCPSCFQILERDSYFEKFGEMSYCDKADMQVKLHKLGPL